MYVDVLGESGHTQKMDEKQVTILRSFNLPDIEQNTISKMMAKAENAIRPKVALPCLLKEQYKPQKPNARLYEGKAAEESTENPSKEIRKFHVKHHMHTRCVHCESIPMPTIAHDARSS